MLITLQGVWQNLSLFMPVYSFWKILFCHKVLPNCCPNYLSYYVEYMSSYICLVGWFPYNRYMRNSTIDHGVQNSSSTYFFHHKISVNSTINGSHIKFCEATIHFGRRSTLPSWWILEFLQVHPASMAMTRTNNEWM